ncbi:hypothetical protein GPM19_07355 [Halomonas sp. ZH2S]|uniref:Uncharacterized protein n=1 Tax=Vreelandella zhuhanensis TaxID=2684210 RepID=A0A7X3KQ22_9GAMM|nr:hypothetical protein [Halomonas zhuhanensis]MWJ28020.1 hypothetical protein [Halomonas zhuhanensis]
MKNTPTDKEKANEKQRAEELIKRDMPKGSPSQPSRPSPEDAKEEVYRPEENVDNQKAGTTTPHHGNVHDDEKELPGWQLTKDKAEHKKHINEATEKAKNPRRNG